MKKYGLSVFSCTEVRSSRSNTLSYNVRVERSAYKIPCRKSAKAFEGPCSHIALTSHSKENPDRERQCQAHRSRCHEQELRREKSVPRLTTSIV